MTNQNTEPTAITFVVLATIALAFKGVFAKFAYNAGMSVDTLLLLRFGIAAPLFWVGVYFLARHTAPLNWAQWKACIFAGAMFFVATYCDFTAISLIGVSISRLILFTFPIIVMLINAVMIRKAPSLHQWGVFFVTYLGIALVMAPHGLQTLAHFDWTGAAWAMGCAVTYAIYLIASQQIMQTLGSVRFTAASGTVTMAIMVAVIPVSVGVDNLTFPDEGVFWSACIAVGCTVIPFFMLFEGIKRCGATQTSLISLSGPVITIFLAWLLLGEKLSFVQTFGAFLTIAGVASLKSAWAIEYVRKFFQKPKPVL